MIEPQPESCLPGYDVVYTVTDYWDGPRKGVANFRGRPIYYENLFDEQTDDYSEVFMLIPISTDLFQLALEEFQIFLRWRTAFDRGEQHVRTHPALPEDRHRFEEISQILQKHLCMDRVKGIKARAEFAPLASARHTLSDGKGLQVRWTTE